MRAIAMTDYESGVALHELPTPQPAPNELLVRVNASSVNRIDVLVAGGVLKGMMQYEFPAVPGRDFAGTVEAVGWDAGRFEVGDEVFGFLTKPTVHEGAWAEYLTVPEDGFVARKPRGLDFTEAAALPLASRSAVHLRSARTRKTGSGRSRMTPPAWAAQFVFPVKTICTTNPAAAASNATPSGPGSRSGST